MSNIVSKTSQEYSNNFDSIFRREKVTYYIKYTDGMEHSREFPSLIDASRFYEEYKETIVTFEKHQLLLEDWYERRII